MLFSVKQLYDPRQVTGTLDVSFTEIAVSGPDGGAGAAFISLQDTYFADEKRALQAQQLGTKIFVGNSLPPEILADHKNTIIKVADPLAELVRLTAALRANSRATFIGVTGSSGKTTTKDMIAHILRGRYKNTLKTFRNYNGLLGVSLTLRKLRDDDCFAVLEIGLGEPGSVDRGAAMVRPHIAVVTGIGESHIGKFVTLETIVEEKSAILRHLAPQGIAVLNADDSRCLQMAEIHSGKVLTFGYTRGCDVQILSVNQAAHDQLIVCLALNGQTLDLSLPVIGSFQASNAAAAVAVATYLGFSPAEIRQRFRTFRSGEQRLRSYVKAGRLVIDDGYNASPQGVQMSLAAFGEVPWPGTRVLIIGDPQDQGDMQNHFLLQMKNDILNTPHDLAVLIGPVVGKLLPDIPRGVYAKGVTEAARLALLATESGGAIFIKGTDDRMLKLVRESILR